MPDFELAQWQLASSEPHAADERNPHPYTLHVYERRQWSHAHRPS